MHDALLRCPDNARYDIPLTAVLTSPMIGDVDGVNCSAAHSHTCRLDLRCLKGADAEEVPPAVRRQRRHCRRSDAGGARPYCTVCLMLWHLYRRVWHMTMSAHFPDGILRQANFTMLIDRVRNLSR